MPILRVLMRVLLSVRIEDDTQQQRQDDDEENQEKGYEEGKRHLYVDKHRSFRSRLDLHVSVGVKFMRLNGKIRITREYL